MLNRDSLNQDSSNRDWLSQDLLNQDLSVFLMNATLKVLKSIAEILVIFENEEEQDFLSYEYSTYE